MKFDHFVIAILIITFIVLAGCSKKIDLHKPLDQIKKEVQMMSIVELQNTAADYANAIKAQKAELNKITDEMKSLPIREIFSDKNKAIRRRLNHIQTEATALLERYQIYVKTFQEKGGDLSKVQIN